MNSADFKSLAKPKESFNLLSYFIHMRLNVNPFFCTKNQKIDFEEKKFSERFGECLVYFTSKDPLMWSLICIKEISKLNCTLATLELQNSCGDLKFSILMSIALLHKKYIIYDFECSTLNSIVNWV